MPLISDATIARTARPRIGMVRVTRAFIVLPLCGVMVVARPLSGQARMQPASAETTIAGAGSVHSAPASPASPRVALTRYLELTRSGDFGGASAYLDVPESLTVAPHELARELKLVLDRNVWFELDDISGLAVGDTADGLPQGVEQVATIRGPDGARWPVRLRRVDGTSTDDSVHWRFSSGTVARIPAWYTALEDRWLLEHLPHALLRTGPFDVLWWQWIALVLLLPVATIVGLLASRLVLALLRRAAKRTINDWDDLAVERLAMPLVVAGALAVAAATLPALGLYAPAATAGYRVVRTGYLVVFFWSLWRMVDVARLVASHTTWARTMASSRSLLPLGARAAKVLVLAIASVAIFSLLGYPVASLVAGLGLGGLALALAAQKTVENLFGAFSIGIDQPFHEGDFVKIEEFVGTVEAIGLRSTRFRTLDRTLISIPNGRLAEMRLESFTARDRLRLATVIGLEAIP